MRLAHLLNTMARFSKDLAGLFSTLGVQAAIGFIRNTLTGPWLDARELEQRPGRPFRLVPLLKASLRWYRPAIPPVMRLNRLSFFRWRLFNKMRIPLIEDDRKIADLITRGLREAGFVIDRVPDGSEGLALAMAMAPENRYDCAVIDLMLPGIDGLTVIECLRRCKVATPVLILSAKRSVDDRILGLQQGGDDYLTKPFAFSELFARIHALIRRSSQVVESSTLNYHDLTIDLLARTVRRGGKRIVLQPKELALLEYLMRNAGRVVSKTMVMERVWDYSFDPGTNVVEARVSRLRSKVDKGYETQLIHTIRGLGYVLRTEHAADT